MRRLQKVQALVLGLQGSAIAVGPWAQLIGHVQATCKVFEEGLHLAKPKKSAR